MKNSERRNIVELYGKIKTFQHIHNNTPTSMYTFEETVNKIKRHIENFCELMYSSLVCRTSSSITLSLIVNNKNTYVAIQVTIFNNNFISVGNVFTLLRESGIYEDIDLSKVNFCNNAQQTKLQTQVVVEHI